LLDCIDVHESNTSESRLDAAPLDHLATHGSAYSYRPIISPTNTQDAASSFLFNTKVVLLDIRSFTIWSLTTVASV